MRHQRFGGKGLDRGRATHGAKWCFVTPKDEMINYAATRTAACGALEEQAAKKVWAHYTKNLKAAGYELFKSQKEAKKFIGLRVAERAGLIRNLRRQVKQALNVRRPDGLEETIGHYIADFTYDERVPAENMARVDWRPVVHETKGYEEDLYIWKKRHFQAQYGVELRQT